MTEIKDKTMQELVTRLRAGFTMFWLRTDELLRAAKTVKESLEGTGKFQVIEFNFELTPDPEEAITKLEKAEGNTVMVLLNYHWFLKDQDGANKMIKQMIKNRVELFASSQKAMIVISHEGVNNGVPAELQPDFTALDFDLPDEAAINIALDYAIDCVKDNPKFKVVDEDTRSALVKAAKGLTQKEIENSLMYSVVKTGGEFNAQMVTDLKAKIVEDEAGLEYSQFPETFESLRGYDVLKDFTKATINSPHAKGIILLGPPGTGKSHFCKCLGNETGMPVLSFEMGAVFGSLVGESEKKMRRVINIIKAMAPCIVFIDEIEKGLAGASGGSSDGGTTQRTMGIFLKFLSDRPANIYVVATCNDVNSVPPEYLRAERWDTAPFFVDLPSVKERAQILEYYKAQYEVDGTVKAEDLEGWSGAEIKALCRIAVMMKSNLEAAINYVVPISSTMKEKIDDLRNWAKGRTLQASDTGKVAVSNGKLRLT